MYIGSLQVILVYHAVGLALSAAEVVLRPKTFAVPADARLFSYNTVLGPIIQIPYNNPALIEGVEALGVGSVRYPGGTVANYWSMRYGNYVSNCNSNCCRYAQNVSSFPQGTFTPHAAMQSSALGRVTTSTPVFDVNMLTFNRSYTLADVQSLAEQVSSPSDVEIFELGNEFYSQHDTWRFPNSSTYMEAAKPIAAEARKLFPDALVMAVAYQRPIRTSSCGGSWNSQLSAYSGVYDGVTLHDYTIGNHTVSTQFPPSQWNTVVAAWSSASVQLAMKGVDVCFGKDTLVAQTEFNYAGATGGKSGPLLFPYGAIHGIFQADRILEAARHVTDTPTPTRRRAAAARIATGEQPSASSAPASSPSIKWSRYVSMHMHALAEDTAVNWDHNSGVLRFNASLGPDARPEVSGVGQVFAHLTKAARPAPWSSFATKPDEEEAAGGSPQSSSSSSPTGAASSQPPASYFIPLEQSGSEHPTIGFAIKDQTGLPCLQASLFASDPRARASPRFAIINRCAETLTAVLPAFDPAQADTWLYSAGDEGGWAPLPGKGAPVPWTSGPLSPRRASVSCSSGGCAVTMPGVCMAISVGAR